MTADTVASESAAFWRRSRTTQITGRHHDGGTASEDMSSSYLEMALPQWEHVTRMMWARPWISSLARARPCQADPGSGPVLPAWGLLPIRPNGSSIKSVHVTRGRAGIVTRPVIRGQARAVAGLGRQRRRGAGPGRALHLTTRARPRDFAARIT